MSDRSHKPARKHSIVAYVTLVTVSLVSLALGVSVGLGSTTLIAIFAGILVGVTTSGVVLLMRDFEASQQKEEEQTLPSVASHHEETLPSAASHEEEAFPSTEINEDGPAPETAEATLTLLDENEEQDLAIAARPAPNEVVNRVLRAAANATAEIDITPSLSSDDWDTVPPSTLDLDTLSRRIVGSSDPIAELKLFVGDIRTREAESSDMPSPFERYAARQLIEAGLLESDVELPAFRIVRPPASGMFYLRIEQLKLPYLSLVRILSIEAALNAIRFSDTYFDDPDAHSVEEHYQLLQKLTHSIAAQSPNLSEHIPLTQDESPDTEWAVRMGISTAIETFQLPHRLAASWRVNVADGNVAIEMELTPEAAFPATRYVEDLGLVATSREMRRKAASDYALKLALLVANAAFRCSELIKHVWVAGMARTATRHACYLSVDFDRWRFSRLDLSDLGDLSEVYHSFAPMMRYEDGILRPVEQTFSLSERRFCPPHRYEPVALSTRKIAKPFSDMLGSERVSNLSIDEAGKREMMAASIAASMGSSTEHNVHLIMELAGDDPDPSVRSAAERTIGKLIEGTIKDDALSVGREFLEGDALSQAVARATEQLANKNLQAAEETLRGVLGPLDAAGIYDDTAYLEYRFFPNYVERALYNRLFALKGRLPLLVPCPYFQAHFLISMAQLMQGKFEDALTHARRLTALAPLDARSHIHLTRCLEMVGRDEEAVEVLTHLLEVAHDPEGIAMAYYRMAFFQMKLNHALAAQACYELSLRYMPPYAPIVAMEMATLAFQVPGFFREDLSDEEAEQALRDRNIPVAPTDEMSEAFLECARASLDAEVFPVARNFAWILGAFTRDDILMGLLRSIEDAPEDQ